MKWFKHEITTTNPKIKLLKKKHGAVGYAIYFQIVELIADRIEKTNDTEWGFLAPTYCNNLEFLAEEIGTDTETLKETLETCHQLNLLNVSDSVIACHQVKERADDYTQRIINKQSGTKPEKQRTNSVDTPNKVLQSLPRIEEKRIDKNILDKSNRSETFGNERVNSLLEVFKTTYGFEATDKNPRQVSWNFVQIIQSYLKNEVGGEVTDERVRRVILAFFEWLKTKDWAANVHNLETLKRKFPIFKASVAMRKGASVSQGQERSAIQATSTAG